jgi:hypothetical protein
VKGIGAHRAGGNFMRPYTLHRNSPGQSCLVAIAVDSGGKLAMFRRDARSVRVGYVPVAQW